MDELNAEQQRAVEAGDGAVLIVAGPGTGKTLTLTARIIYLLEGGTNPGAIIALTFTNKAAREMRERLGSILPNRKLPKICTFHALGAELLKRSGGSRKLVSETERLEIIRELKKPAAFKGMSLRELSLAVSRAKTSLGEVDNPLLRRLLEQYEQVLAGQNLHDYDDLLCKSFELLRSDEDKRPDYKYVLVDEFQDTSELQYELLKLLGGKNIFAIGDPNQSIYAFRGAGAAMFGTFQKDFPETQLIDLTVNYRSRPEIVKLANRIFPDAPQLVAVSKEPGRAHALHTLNEYSEAGYVINEIEKGIGGSDFLHAHADGEARQPRDYAVLYRTHRAARPLQKAFAEAGLPFQIAGEGSPYEKPEIQTILAELRTSENPDKLSVHDLARQIAAEKNFKVEDMQQFLSALVQFGADVAAALKHIDEIAEQEFYDSTVNAVTLLTVHASKGLEFDHVFLIAAEEGILPKAEDTAEEKRLFYVAATRAKENLEIIHTKFRASESSKASRFITELPESILPRVTDPNLPALEKRHKKRAAKRAQTTLF